MSHIPSNLLTVSSDAKTIKGEKYGFMTGILYLSPADISGHNVCAMADIAGCKKPCLNMAGRGVMSPVQAGRLNKTLAFFEMREKFMLKIADDVRKLVKRAAKKSLTPLVRLNGTSDIRWETIPVAGFPSIMAMFPDVQFYDYTKLSNRKDLPPNYDLTFSYSGLIGYQKYVKTAVANGMRLAVVFRERANIPETFLGMQCVDGDNSDIRHLDPKATVVALYAKGPAKKDASGFVVDSARRTIPIFSF